MKTLTEYSSFILKPILEKKQALVQEQKTPEEVSQAIGETFKLEGDKLTFVLHALDLYGNRLDTLKRVLVSMLSEGEKSPQGGVEKDGKWFTAEFFPPLQRKGRGRDDARGDRDHSRGDRKGGRKGKRGPKRGDNRGESRTENNSERAARPPRAPRPPRQPQEAKLKLEIKPVEDKFNTVNGVKPARGLSSIPVKKEGAPQSAQAESPVSSGDSPTA